MMFLPQVKRVRREWVTFKGHLGSRGHESHWQEVQRAWDTDLYIPSSLLTPFCQRTPSLALILHERREARDAPALTAIHGDRSPSSRGLKGSMGFALSTGSFLKISSIRSRD